MTNKFSEIDQMYSNVAAICLRIENLNPTKPDCAYNAKSCLKAFEIGCAIDFIYQGILNDDDDFLLDISLHDLMYLMSIAPRVKAREHNLADFAIMSEDVLKNFERETILPNDT